MRRRIETDLAWRGGGGGGGGGGTPLNSQDVQELTDKALATLSRHLWFLAPNTVLFTLASEKLEDDDTFDKSRITVKLVSAKTKGDTFGTSNLSLVD